MHILSKRSLIMLALAAGCWFAAMPAAAADGSERPNIIFILADDMGIGDIGAYNDESKIPTPHLDRLAEQGMRFTDAHAPGSVCMPSRYGLLTGRYPFRGNWRKWRKQAVIEPGRTTIASLLKEAGYATAMVGKWHLGFEGGNTFRDGKLLRGGPVDHGFERYFGMHASLDIPPYFYIRNDQIVAAPSQAIEGNRPGEDSFWTPIQGAFWRSGPISPGLHLEGTLPRWREKAVGYLEQHHRHTPEKPFFLYLALTAPHTPWLPLEKFQGTSDAGMYGDFVVQVDDLVGSVQEALERLGMAEDTLIIFTSDNGPVWYEKDEKRFDHRSTDIYRGMKGDAWEGGHRMPFIARWPGHVPAGSTSDQTICFTDMLATFAAIVGEDLPKNAGADSYNILPALLGEADEPIREATVHNAIRYLAIRQGPWKLIPGLGSGGFSKPRRIKPGPDDPKGQLYNLEEDPSEENNVYQQHPQIVKRLSDLLEEYKSSERTRPASSSSGG